MKQGGSLEGRLAVGLHEPARDRLRDTSGPWFRAGRLGAGEKLRGHVLLGVDGWAPYRCFKEATLQTCYNHLLHRCHELLETATGGAVRFPRLVKAILRHALALRDRLLDALARSARMACALPTDVVTQANEKRAAARPIHQSSWGWPGPTARLAKTQIWTFETPATEQPRRCDSPNDRSGRSSADQRLCNRRSKTRRFAIVVKQKVRIRDKSPPATAGNRSEGSADNGSMHSLAQTITRRASSRAVPCT